MSMWIFDSGGGVVASMTRYFVLLLTTSASCIKDGVYLCSFISLVFSA